MLADAVAIAPELYKVRLENDRVRVLEVSGEPGTRSHQHSHPAQVAVALTTGTYRFTSPDGEVTEATLDAGTAMYLEPVEHATELLGPAGSSILLIELK